MKFKIIIFMVLCLMVLFCVGGSNMDNNIDWGSPKMKLQNSRITLQLSVHNTSNALLILTNTDHLVYEIAEDRLLLSMYLHEEPPLYCGDSFQARGISVEPGESYTFNIDKEIKMYDNRPYISDEQYKDLYVRTPSIKEVLKKVKWFSLKIGYIKCTSSGCPIGKVKQSFLAEVGRGFGGTFPLNEVQSIEVFYGKVRK